MLMQLHLTSLMLVTAEFRTGGIRGYGWLQEKNPGVIVRLYGIPFRNESVWQIHEFPVDLSIDPKLRCRSEFIGPMKYNGSDGEPIDDVTGTSLILHSIVLLVNDRVATCATIEIDYIYIIATVDFRLGVFGRMQLMKWSCEWICVCVQHKPLLYYLHRANWSWANT